MADLKRDIRYIDRDFNQFRNALINYSKTYFPDTFNDFSDTSTGMLVIIKGEAEKISNIESDKYFESRPFGSKIGAIVSDQSRVISDRTVMEAKLEALKIEYQNKEIKRPEYWGGYLVRPICIEFWQGRPNRLHDRVRCQLKSGLWNLERLAP